MNYKFYFSFIKHIFVIWIYLKEKIIFIYLHLLIYVYRLLNLILKNFILSINALLSLKFKNDKIIFFSFFLIFFFD